MFPWVMFSDSIWVYTKVSVYETPSRCPKGIRLAHLSKQSQNAAALEAPRISTESRRLINSDTKTVATGPDGTSILHLKPRLNSERHAHVWREAARLTFPNKQRKAGAAALIEAQQTLHSLRHLSSHESVFSRPAIDALVSTLFILSEEKTKQHQLVQNLCFQYLSRLSCLLSPDMCCIFYTFSRCVTLVRERITASRHCSIFNHKTPKTKDQTPAMMGLSLTSINSFKNTFIMQIIRLF